MIVMRSERLARPAVPPSSREAMLELDNIALKSRVAALEAELARYKGTGTMIPLEAFGALAGVIKAAAAVGGVTVEELKSQRKGKRLCLLRQAAMYVAYRNVGRLSYPQIARHFGDRDHTTAMHAVTRIQRDVDAAVATTMVLLDDIRAAAGVGGDHP